ncbi:nuclear transport factor 2 family protein [Janthinobacterium agaricidamnosum]|uniref:Uncharacterized domain protein n=1 Tax=Janthinobacterium agaricidamnosum NBRC 102515 = DSM 9628 TaxID=1349767 RepID=W0VA80_9BURK|nr:nuclear transport factor 2 family protein [Janthinobacterium agaricidamnosum]CDG85729.1 putative uncharacterized domain protein [Janthinobacterium agaricidamnosum NBRC 102515 = DSM 9628]
MQDSPYFAAIAVAGISLAACAAGTPAHHSAMKNISAPVIAKVKDQATVDAYLAAVNGNRLPDFLSLFTGDGLVNDWGSRYRGPQEITKWSNREFIGVQVSLKVSAVSQDGNQIAIDAQVGGKGFNGPSRFVLLLDGASIKEMRITGGPHA